MKKFQLFISIPTSKLCDCCGSNEHTYFRGTFEAENAEEAELMVNNTKCGVIKDMLKRHRRNEPNIRLYPKQAIIEITDISDEALN